MTDEVVPEDENEEITIEGRWCSGVEIVVTVGGGRGREDKGKGKGKGKKGKKGEKGPGEVGKDRKNKGMENNTAVVVVGSKVKRKGKGREGGREQGEEEQGGDEDVGMTVVEEDEMDAMNG